MIDIAIEKRLKGAGGEMTLSFTCSEPKGVFMSMFGASGSGKTSILRMICGLMKPDKGHIRFQGETWFDSQENIDLKPQKRDVGIVFQDYGLFPNMTAKDNVLYALPKKEDKSQVHEILERVGLRSLADQNVTRLSGGQQQRVALARTLVQSPSLLLLDEPLSATDLNARKEIQKIIAELHAENELTTILVSHDKDEIMQLSDLVFHIENGIITQRGLPYEVLFANTETMDSRLKTEVLNIIDESEKRYAIIKINDRLVRIPVEESTRQGDIISIKLT